MGGGHISKNGAMLIGDRLFYLKAFVRDCLAFCLCIVNQYTFHISKHFCSIFKKAAVNHFRLGFFFVCLVLFCLINALNDTAESSTGQFLIDCFA